MKILAISGSMRLESTNSCLLREISNLASQCVDNLQIELFSAHGDLPIFSPDQEGKHTPDSVIALCKKISLCDGIIISSPEYVRSIPGGLKNTIDWLVSRDEIIKKPIVLVHASHRGEDLLTSLRRVLNTISDHFSNNIFLQIPLVGKDEKEIKQIINSDEYNPLVSEFILNLSNFIKSIQ